MRNLISNALDHSEGKPIEIECVETRTEVAVSVRDHGEGMEEASLTRVFDRFWRADPSRARTRGGTGLGLSIVKKCVDLHKRDIRIDSQLGKGTTVTVTIPYRRLNQA
jgi:two-component system sensor histidine kinase MtrB